MAPKTAMKAMKTATKRPRSMKTMKATTAKGKSKNAKDKSPDYYFDCLSWSDDMRFLVRHIFLGPTAQVNFLFKPGPKHPCTKTPEQLEDLVAKILPSLQAIASASNAHQVHAFYSIEPLMDVLVANVS